MVFIDTATLNKVLSFTSDECESSIFTEYSQFSNLGGRQVIHHQNIACQFIHIQAKFDDEKINYPFINEPNPSHRSIFTQIICYCSRKDAGQKNDKDHPNGHHFWIKLHLFIANYLIHSTLTCAGWSVPKAGKNLSPLQISDNLSSTSRNTSHAETCLLRNTRKLHTIQSQRH